MRILVMSDLHLEFGDMDRNWNPPECDAVILAGDIATGVVGVMWAKTIPAPVFYVPGNHEFYGKRRYHRHMEKLHAKAEDSNVAVMQNRIIQGEIAGEKVRILGATMWTDFGLHGTEHLSQVAAQREMNDYKQIRMDHSKMLMADDTRRLHLESKFWLSEQLRQPFDGKTIVITHHAPSEQSVPDRYRGDSLSPAYAARLENLICNYEPTLWVHGHIHDSMDYRICETRIVCNPRGYKGHELNKNFNPHLVVEI